MTGTEVVAHEGDQVVSTVRDLNGYLVDRIDVIAMVAAKIVEPERVVQTAIWAATHNPDILRCTPHSVLLAVMEAGMLGLSCTAGPLGEGALVPFKGVCSFMPMYRGLVKLARQSGEVNHVTGYVVREGDEFDYEYGTTPQVIHRPMRGGPPGDLTDAYAVAVLDNGERPFVVMEAWEIAKIQASAPGAKNPTSPWVKWPDRQWRKSAIKRLCKDLPLSADAAEAVRLDDLREAGEAAIHSALEGIDFDAPPTTSAVVSIRDKIQKIAAAETKGEEDQAAQPDEAPDAGDAEAPDTSEAGDSGTPADGAESGEVEQPMACEGCGTTDRRRNYVEKKVNDVVHWFCSKCAKELEDAQAKDDLAKARKRAAGDKASNGQVGPASPSDIPDGTLVDPGKTWPVGWEVYKLSETEYVVFDAEGNCAHPEAEYVGWSAVHRLLGIA